VTLQTASTFAIHYKRTFYIFGVSQQLVAEMSVRRCVKEPVDQGRGRCPGGQGPDFQKIVGKILSFA